MRTIATLAAGILLVLPAGGADARPSDATVSPPCAAGGPPSVRLVPSAAPVGARVRVRGRCFEQGLDLGSSGYGIILIRQFTRPRECELIAGGRQRLRVDAGGVGRGYVRIPRRGACFQHDYGRRVTPGRYGVAIGCHACRVATLRVTR